MLHAILAVALLAPFTLAAGPRAGVPEAAPHAAWRADRPLLARLPIDGRRVVIPGVPLRPGLAVTLEVERFRVFTPGARFVAVLPDGAESDIAYDPESTVHLRGVVAGKPASHVTLSISDRVTTGRISLGPGEESFIVAAGPGDPGGAPGGELRVIPAGAVRSRAVGPAWCGVGHEVTRPAEGPVPPPPGGGPGAGVTDEPKKGLQQIQLAVDTDYEYYERFFDVTLATDYIAQLYAQVSAIYMRDVNSRVDLSYVRIWTTNTDPYTNPDPLTQFRTFWNTNMGSVTRDTAQLLSGRVDLPYGGVAYLDALCTNNGYSVSGYTLGFYAYDPTTPHVDNRDIMITAHELGHNCSALHSHDYGIDQCQLLSTPPTRGDIMSYCGQTVSGSDACQDLRFHTTIQADMKAFIFSRSCVADDCNGNGRLDSIDISTGFSLDVNSNGIPDECEDCNGNSVLDTIDIATGASLDLNSNTIPDECEPDCNNNGVPDDRDIALGTSTDLHGNGVPDECETDADGNGVSDYRQIMLSMPLDKNRDTRLDAFEDCDGDGIPDITELDHSNFAWVAGIADDTLRQFHSSTGVLTIPGPTGFLDDPQDVLITPDRRVLVTSANDDKIAEFNISGAFVRNLVAPGAGGLDYPTCMTISPAGTLLVSSRNTNSVKEFDIVSGAFIRDFVAAGAGGLTQPFGLQFDPTEGRPGNLFVAGSDNRVREYDRNTGAFVRIFVAAGAGGLSNPRGILFMPSGHLLVASHNTNALIRFNGVTGASMGNWSRSGNGTVLPLERPWCVRLGPSGNVFASRHLISTDLHINSTRIFEYDIRDGHFVHSFVTGNDTGLYNTTGFDFVPDAGTDCNHNSFPDNCDILSGRSEDRNHNGIPDECETCRIDYNFDGEIDFSDIEGFLVSYSAGILGTSAPGADLNGDGEIDFSDIEVFLALYVAGC